MKQPQSKKKLDNFNFNKIALYKDFYIKQKTFHSFKSNRYNFSYSNQIIKGFSSSSTSKNFKLNNFLKNSNSNLVLNFKKGLINRKTFPHIKERQSFLNS